MTVSSSTKVLCPPDEHVFRAHVRIPAVLHFGPTEQALDLYPIRPDETVYEFIECCECDLHSDWASTAAEWEALRSGQRTMEETLEGVQFIFGLEESGRGMPQGWAASESAIPQARGCSDQIRTEAR